MRCRRCHFLLTMSNLTKYTNAKPDLTSEEKELLRKAGASEELIEVCEFDCTKAEHQDGSIVTKNSVLREVKKYLRGTDVVPPDLTHKAAEDFKPYGGHLFQHVWDGELYYAYNRADHNNKPIMLEVFGLGRINRGRPKNASMVKA